MSDRQRKNTQIPTLSTSCFNDIFLKNQPLKTYPTGRLFTMALKRGLCFLLFIVACAGLAKAPDPMTGNKAEFSIARKLMIKCQEKEYAAPEMSMLKAVFNNSDVLKEDRDGDPPKTLLFIFLKVLNSVTGDMNKTSLGQLPKDVPDKMTNKMWKCRNLSAMIKLIRKSPESSACYMKAFMAPLAWKMLTAQSENKIDSNNLKELQWASRDMLQEVPSARRTLLTKVDSQNMEQMMKMWEELYDFTSESERTQVSKWAKEQIVQNCFNCTMTPPSSTHSKLMDRCRPSLKWLSSEALTMMGRYLPYLTADDVDSCPKEKLCEFFQSGGFRSATRSAIVKLKPTLYKKFVQRYNECFSGEEFLKHLEKLGPPACYLNNLPALPPDLGKRFLLQLNNCDNPKMINLKKRLVNSMMANFSSAQTVHDLGRNAIFLSLKQCSALPANIVKDVLKDPTLRWTPCQRCILIKKQLGDTCNKVSCKALRALQSVAEGLPISLLKNIKAQEILNDTEALKNICTRMRKGQLKAMMQKLKVHLLKKLPSPLLCHASLSALNETNITSLDQVENKTWCRSQAAFLAKKMCDLNQLKFRRLGSVLQGVTCKMIEKIPDSEIQDLAEDITKTPQWLGKVQAGCLARKLFAALEKKRADYFKTVTEQELEDIPTDLLPHLSPSKVKDLPDSVCQVLLDKMENARLNLLPVRAPSRPALTQRALRCLGKDLTELTVVDVSKLGPLLWELSCSTLDLMGDGVRRFIFVSMASCQCRLQCHGAALFQLINQTFGAPSDWTAETMEALLPLLVLDDDAISALPNKPWMKDVLYSLMSRLPRVSRALKKKSFDLATTISTTTNATADNNNTDTHRSIAVSAKPTEPLIDELGRNNIYWTPAQLAMIPTDTFQATVETFGACSGYSADQLAVLSKKAVEAFGPVLKMTECQVMQLGCIIQGFAESNLEKLPISLDFLVEIAHCGWTESQMKSVWKSVAKYNNLTALQLGASEMVALNSFICGLTSSEIGQISVDAFKEAVGSMNDIQCPFKIMQQVKNLALAAFGNSSSWTEAQVSELGNIITGLTAAEWASLDPSVFSFINMTSFPLIPPENMAALSVAQLKSLGADNADMVTRAQLAALSDDQKAAVDQAATGSYDQSLNTEESGAPSLSVEGISAFMKPLLFLFMGFLLL